MSNVNNDSRPSFFPNSKTAQARQAKKLAQMKRQQAQAYQNRTPVRSSKSIDVNISEGLKDFARIKELANNAPEIDKSEKIAMLREQINNGTYGVDYDGLANKLLLQEFN